MRRYSPNYYLPFSAIAACTNFLLSSEIYLSTTYVLFAVASLIVAASYTVPSGLIDAPHIKRSLPCTPNLAHISSISIAFSIASSVLLLAISTITSCLALGKLLWPIFTKITL